jgi:HK97 family phage major capsid protein
MGRKKSSLHALHGGTKNFTTGVNLMNAKDFLESKKAQQEARTNRPDFGGGSYGGNAGNKTAGQIFTQSQAYKNFLAHGQSTSDNVSIPAFTKAIITSRDTGGGLMGAMPIIGAIERPLTIRDLLNVQPTTNNAVDYIRETGFTNASAIAPESTLKAESSLSFESVTALVKTIAHWIPATKQVLDDIPQMQSFIDGRLLNGLAQTEESQILYGSGVGENIEGIMVNPDIQTYVGVEGDTKIDVIRKAMTLTHIANYQATGIVLHPNDWEKIELTKATDGQYIFVNVNTGGEQRLWRVPVVVSNAIVEGEFLTGAFGLGAQLWDREVANVRISEHHADYFTRNMKAVLAEERIALSIYRPEAFVKGTFEPTV